MIGFVPGLPSRGLAASALISALFFVCQSGFAQDDGEREGRLQQRVDEPVHESDFGRLRSEDESPGKDDPRFAGIELGPGILKALRHKIRIDDWRQREIDAYYEVLAHAGAVPYASQKQTARRNLLENIEHYRRNAEAEYRGAAERIEQLRRDKPDEGEKHDRMEQTARRKLDRQLRLYRTFKDDPDEFPMFVMMFKSLDSSDPGRYHGRLVTLKGHVRKLISYPARKNDFGIETLYEAWIFTPQSQNVPAVVISASKPEGMPEGEGRNYSVEASVTGYVFKMHVYTGEDGTPWKAPMILAGQIDWRPPPPERAVPPWVFAAIGGAFLALVGTLFWVGRKDKLLRRRRLQNSLKPGL